MSSLASAESSNESFPSLLVEATTRFFGLGLQTKVGTRLLIGKISPEFLFYFKNKNEEEAVLEHRHPRGHNHLTCFAHPSVSWRVAKHYRYEWRKNGERLKPSHSLLEIVDNMIKPPGSVLTLGKIQVIWKQCMTARGVFFNHLIIV